MEILDVFSLKSPKSPAFRRPPIGTRPPMMLHIEGRLMYEAALRRPSTLVPGRLETIREAPKERSEAERLSGLPGESRVVPVDVESDTFIRMQVV